MRRVNWYQRLFSFRRVNSMNQALKSEIALASNLITSQAAHIVALTAANKALTDQVNQSSTSSDAEEIAAATALSQLRARVTAPHTVTIKPATPAVPATPVKPAVITAPQTAPSAASTPVAAAPVNVAPSAPAGQPPAL